MSLFAGLSHHGVIGHRSFGCNRRSFGNRCFCFRCFYFLYWCGIKTYIFRCIHIQRGTFSIHLIKSHFIHFCLKSIGNSHGLRRCFFQLNLLIYNRCCFLRRQIHQLFMGRITRSNNIKLVFFTRSQSHGVSARLRIRFKNAYYFTCFGIGNGNRCIFLLVGFCYQISFDNGIFDSFFGRYNFKDRYFIFSTGARRSEISHIFGHIGNIQNIIIWRVNGKTKVNCWSPQHGIGI